MNFFFLRTKRILCTTKDDERDRIGSLLLSDSSLLNIENNQTNEAIPEREEKFSDEFSTKRRVATRKDFPSFVQRKHLQETLKRLNFDLRFKQKPNNNS